MKKNVTLKMVSERYETDTPEILWNIENKTDTEPQRIEIFTEAVYSQTGKKVEISYNESELSGMQGSSTRIMFSTDNPGTVTMFRSGAVSSSMVFSSGLRHTYIYKTPIMPIRMSILTRTVRNRITEDGTLYLDYINEVAESGHARITMHITVYSDREDV